MSLQYARSPRHCSLGSEASPAPASMSALGAGASLVPGVLSRLALPSTVVSASDTDRSSESSSDAPQKGRTSCQAPSSWASAISHPTYSMPPECPSLEPSRERLYMDRLPGKALRKPTATQEAPAALSLRWTLPHALRLIPALLATGQQPPAPGSPACSTSCCGKVTTGTAYRSTACTVCRTLAVLIT